jgi:hypothetical protein
MRIIVFHLLVTSMAWAKPPQVPPPALPEWTPAHIAEFQKLDADARQDLIKLAKVGKADAGEGPLVELIPFAFFAAAVAIVALVLVYARRRSQLLHETIRVCVEKGAPIPRELLVPPRKPRSDLHRGIGTGDEASFLREACVFEEAPLACPEGPTPLSADSSIPCYFACDAGTRDEGGCEHRFRLRFCRDPSCNPGIQAPADTMARVECAACDPESCVAGCP